MTRPNLNYYLYKTAHGAAYCAKRCIPAYLVPAKKDLSGDFSIGITTYIARYEKHFKPLYSALCKHFPDVKLIVAVNGFSDRAAHQKYLDRFSREICANSAPSRSFIIHDRPVGCSRLWNEILGASLQSPALILNDDLRIYPYLRRWAESLDWGKADITLLNSIWSNFIISENIVRQVGAFDENFTGIGFEDMDYTARAYFAGVSIANTICPYICHKDLKPEKTSFDDISGKIWGKFTSANHDYFFKKWRKCAAGEGAYIKQIASCVEPAAKQEFIPLKRLPIGGQGNIYYPDRMQNKT
jgi:hypothetical protein